MTMGEAGLASGLAVFAFVCLIGAAMGHDQAFSFHAALACIASLISVIAFGNRYLDRPAELPPAEIRGRPNYNRGPIKFASA
ncbi:cytochrome C oxidase, partial [Serratia marcescens]|nr:cytochrome C oxidase [Serratia marcescens]